ncbi:hypothetical protein AXYL_06330 [Achromobacter xylosoxidans A8]|uniref:Uncharacterized protein n=1 Tax=Achromobacter xylosoxidans (strain A8) TaxID=762376 RepID=E3HQI9_ACHXA|nr:hypothetical protein [Achromobacter xylosoxidans]ADP19623.1 hypothetical protein AXYL_06330 [Achromobacter xylosoxidans A8]
MHTTASVPTFMIHQAKQSAFPFRAQGVVLACAGLKSKKQPLI